MSEWLPALWYAALAVMLTGYAVLDGFDFGVGMLHLWVARDDRERRSVLGAIGPWWDGNEVWLLAAGGVLFVAFPAVLALAFPAFYLAFFLVLWCLVLRGIAIELRGHVHDAMWRGFWDVVFAAASALLALLFGVALGNLVRGLPVAPDRPFTMPFFTDFGATDFTATGAVGLLDWYTLLVGAFVVVVLLRHGAAFLALRTDGPVRERSLRAERRLRWPELAGFVGVTGATALIRPALFAAMASRPGSWAFIALAAFGVGLRVYGRRRERDGMAWLGSCLAMAGVLLAAAAALWPVLLPSTLGAGSDVTVAHGGAGTYALSVALCWWPVAFVLAGLYFAFVGRTLARAPIRVPETRR